MLRETDKQLPEGSSETFVQARGAGPQARGARPRRARNARGGTHGHGAAAHDRPERRRRERRDEAELTEQRLTFREAASVIVNAETGIVTVRATSRQHEKVHEFLDAGDRLVAPPGADRGDHRRGAR